MDKLAFFLDLDGTLLDDNREITRGNRAYIEKALSLGHKIIITTGRPLVSALKQAASLNLTGKGCYLIAYNGGVLYNTGEGEIIKSAAIDKAVIPVFFDEAVRRGIHIQTYDSSYVLVEPSCNKTFVENYCKKIAMEYRIIDSVRNLAEDPVKMLMIDYDHPENSLTGYREWVEETFGDSFDTFFSCREFVEIVPKGTNKGNAVVELSGYLGIPLENTIAVGDAENDFTLLESAGTGVCMSNGCDMLKQIADYITENDNNNDGIAEVISRYTGIKLYGI